LSGRKHSLRSITKETHLADFRPTPEHTFDIVGRAFEAGSQSDWWDVSRTTCGFESVFQPAIPSRQLARTNKWDGTKVHPITRLLPTIEGRQPHVAVQKRRREDRSPHDVSCHCLMYWPTGLWSSQPSGSDHPGSISCFEDLQWITVGSGVSTRRFLRSASNLVPNLYGNLSLILLSPNQEGTLDYCCHEPTSLVRSLGSIYAAADDGNSDGLKQGLYLKQI
jgi:hypothetical protein